jgi:DNA polymerase-1
MKKTFLILDSNSILHRAFHALPQLTTKSGEPTNAVYGFCLILFRIIKDFNPDYVCACFDFPAKTFRHEKLKEYKAQRPPTPDELKSQIPKIKKILESLGIPCFEKEGFEADDIVSTIKEKIKNEKNFEILVVSGDNDLLQLVDEKTKVLILIRGIKNSVLFDREKVKEKFEGLEPFQIPDFKALVGDSSDNISGIFGIGKKTAIKILLKFGNLENLYQQIENSSAMSKELESKVKENLIKEKEKAFFLKQMVKLQNNVPLDYELEECRFGNYDQEEVAEVLKKFEFFSLIKKLPQKEKETKQTLNLW